METSLEFLNKHIDFNEDGIVNRANIIRAMNEYTLMHLRLIAEYNPNQGTYENLQDAISFIEACLCTHEIMDKGRCAVCGYKDIIQDEFNNVK